MVVATQNPVDLDYKAMANAGSWFIGRLQTENDKKRVLEGLRSAAGGVDVEKLDTAIGGLEQRQFLLQSAHRGEPELFSTRWAMSFLRGPLTKEQIETLTPDEAEGNDGRRRRGVRCPAEATAAPTLAEDESAVAPAVAPGTSVRYLDPARPGRRRSAPQRTASACRPSSLPVSACATTTRRPGSTRPRSGRRSTGRSTPASTSTTRPPSTTTTATSAPSRSTARATCSPVAPIDKESFFRDAARSIQRRVTDQQTLELFRCAGLNLYSRPGETREQFEARADEAAQAAADAETAKIRDRLEAKRDRLDRALETARRKVEEAGTEQSSRRSTELLSGVGSVIGVLLGGKANTRTIARAGRALGSAASRRGMTSRAGERKRTAEERVETRRGRPRGARAGAARRGGRDRRQVEGEGGRDRDGRDPARSTDVRVVETTLLWVPTA